MYEKKNKQEGNQYSASSARKPKDAEIYQQDNCCEAGKEAGLDGFQEKQFQTLTPRCPNPMQEREPLSKIVQHKLKSQVMRYLKKLCKKRNIRLNMKYWEHITEQILAAPSGDCTMVVPARAGAGKSTWILAFLLALCDVYVNEKALAESLGGVMLVLQTVEALNEVVDAIKVYFPDDADAIITVLQGWHPSGVKRGFCKNRMVQSFSECRRERCAFASTCKILEFQRNAPQAFIVGMTQVRFIQLRNSAQGIASYIDRLQESQLVHRRFVIFDEKFEMAHAKTISLTAINQVSNEIEKRGNMLNREDRKLQSMQAGLARHVTRAYGQLRAQTMCRGVTGMQDKPFGVISLQNGAGGDREEFQRFLNSTRSYQKDLVGSKGLECLSMMETLHQEDCVFCKQGGFQIFHAETPQTVYGQAQTIIFDATARVDGDYLHLEGAAFLDESPALHMDKVTLHVFTSLSLNVSRSAMKKPWKLPAFAALIEEILVRYPGQTFLSTYKEYATYLPELIAEEVMSFLAFMEEKEEPCLPYFGGTNGSNRFHNCTNVILLGYPRLDPKSYLFRAYAAWQKRGILEEMVGVLSDFEIGVGDAHNALQCLPMLQEYESMHLAARMEQEIYRCALRNTTCDEEIHVFLFAPPEGAWALLLERFSGCHVEYIDDLPDCVAREKASVKQYGGRPTAFHKLSTFLHQWDGASIHSKTLREQLEISESAWKDLLRDEKTRALLAEHQVVREGRGANTIWKREVYPSAA